MQSAPPPPSSVSCALPSGGVRVGAYGSIPVSLCANPPQGRPPCAVPWGTVSGEGFREGGCAFLPLSPLMWMWDVAAPPPSLWGPLAQPTSGGHGGASPVAQAAGLSVHREAQSAFAAASPMVLRAGEPLRSPGPRPGHKAFSWGEGDHNHPLPTPAACLHHGDPEMDTRK